ncbi:MAG: hypothetical protein FJZ01_07780 [Candidatus Sericytochromatia bacterium]|nr:hypothetical protein [Candidatus Tanganyikabacteria bacterium]
MPARLSKASVRAKAIPQIGDRKPRRKRAARPAPHLAATAPVGAQRLRAPVGKPSHIPL